MTISKKDLQEITIDICTKLIKLNYDKFFGESGLTLLEKDIKPWSIEIIKALQQNDIKATLEEIKEAQFNFKDEQLAQKQLKKLQKEYCINFINNKMLEPSKLSDSDIIELCNEFYNEFVLISKDCKEYPKKPTVKLIKLGEYIKTPSWRFRGSNYAVISNIFQGRILDQRLSNNRCRSVFSWKLTYPYNIKNILNINICTFGGIIGSNWGYDNIYYGLIGELNIDNPINKLFWDWYIKSLDVLAMYYLKKDNTCYVIKKPDELKINVDKKEMYFRYGEEEFYYKNKVKLPNWLYKTKPEDLKIEDFLLLQNADAKAVFVEKFGIDRLAKFGTVIDSYENYPDNEMWAKSEYKIIDMHELIPPRKTVDQFGNVIGKTKHFSYAPYLYMKNQTTGVYHLEGIHPRCKTLYDAIKMRYNGLNISDFEIKDIK